LLLVTVNIIYLGKFLIRKGIFLFLPVTQKSLLLLLIFSVMKKIQKLILNQTINLPEVLIRSTSMHFKPSKKNRKDSQIPKSFLFFFVYYKG